MESGFSDTVTVFDVPEGMTADDILERMREKHGDVYKRQAQDQSKDQVTEHTWYGSM